MKTNRCVATRAATIATALLSVAAHAQAPQPSRDELTAVVQQFLVDHGDLCIGKGEWPRDLTAEESRSYSNDALQLPVLERLGVVESTEIGAPGSGTPVAAALSATHAASAPAGPVRRYDLTAKGRQSYLDKQRITLGHGGDPRTVDGDLCPGHLSLDHVVKWTPPEQFKDHLETLVHYTYHIKYAGWMDDPEARKVFPVVDRIIRGDGKMLMTVTAMQRDGKWVPALPGQ